MVRRLLHLAFLAFVCLQYIMAGIVEGDVKDARTGETLIGASIILADGKGTTTDVDGHYRMDLTNGKHTLTIRYMGYKTLVKDVVVRDGVQKQDFSLTEESANLTQVQVVGEASHGTEASLMREQQEAHVSMTSVSGQYIRRTQDKDASEVMRRIPGVSLIDEKFVMVRGLSQRYNNVWMNGAAVPSSEADQRAFSFDIIPSSQIDNMKVVKSSAPDYPADFTGGFIMVNTKDVPQSNSWTVSLGGSLNSETLGKDYLYNCGSRTDFLGFDNGKRSLDGGINASLGTQGNGFSLLGNGLSNDWRVKGRRPLGDLALASDVTHRWKTMNGHTWGLTGSLNYGLKHRIVNDMANNMFGAYDQTHDRSNYLRRATDDQYTQQARLGALLGVVWLSAANRHRVEMKHIFNQLGKDRYTYRRGIDAQNDYMEQAEYYYQSRLTYNLGLTGRHLLGDRDRLGWNAGYAYSNRNLPDRRRYTIYGQEDGSLEVENLNDINREFSFLKEHIFSAGTDWKHDFAFSNWQPSLKVGVYAEHRRRKYDTRFFTYAWPTGQLPQQLRNLDVPTELLTESNYGTDGLYLLEQVDWSNNYEARNTQGSGFVSLLLPLPDKRLEAYGGVRFESSHTELVSHTRRQSYSPLSTYFDYNDFFPSLNLTYHLNKVHQLRLAYGRTTNRPEFRELSTSVYYDFDLASNVQGNHDLKPAYIDNVDLGWEWYPHAGEVVSVSLFYKHFRNPIEWTYTVAGGTDLVYSYMNAQGAGSYGVEVDVRKQLDMFRLPQLSVSLNAALIKSSVDFPEGSREKDRPMQGQSPYLVNLGLFYGSDAGKPSHKWQKGWTAALMYNIIGKRIIGVGRSVGSGETDVRVPDSYEMPRHQIDLNMGKSVGCLDLRLSIRDLLAQKVQYKQFEQTTQGEVQQVTRSYRPGCTFMLTASINGLFRSRRGQSSDPDLGNGK